MKINIKEIIADFKNRTHVNVEEYESYLVTPFFFKDSSDSTPLKFYEENGVLIISDCGCTKDYLDIRYVEISEFQEKINKIKERFDIEEKGQEFIMKFPSNQIISIEMFIGFFIQGITLIANVDI